MRNKNILQKANNNKTISVSVRIPAILHLRLKNIQDSARQNGMKFPLSSVIIDALSNAVNIAENEISSIRKSENILTADVVNPLDKLVM